MIHMPHVHSKFSLLLQSWVIIHQFSIFWSFVSLERFLCLSDACQFYYKHFTCKYFGMRSMYLPPFSKRHIFLKHGSIPATHREYGNS
jgi:hypothetical protein